MPTTNMHPNSQAMLDAWERMTATPEDLAGGPPAYDYPGLLGCLFILQGGLPGKLPFRIAGDDLSGLLGRNLIGSNFLDIWSAEDRPLLSALVEKVLSEHRPAIVRGQGAIGRRKSVNIEVVFAPLDKTGVGRDRILALYQVLGSDRVAQDIPIGTHSLTALFPPEPEDTKVELRLVACND
ncbi:MAG: PAS domain-containing protein [Pseudomonadota bacterium]